MLFALLRDTEAFVFYWITTVSILVTILTMQIFYKALRAFEDDADEYDRRVLHEQAFSAQETIFPIKETDPLVEVHDSASETAETDDEAGRQ